MGNVARRLARWRVPAGYVIGIVAFWYMDPTAASLAMGAVVASAGEALRIWAAGHIEKGREVTRSGPYRLVRHPLYFGWALLVFGAPHMTGDRFTFAVVSTIYLAIAIPFEERGLDALFGPAYGRYRKHVRWRMLPGLY